MRYKRKKGVNVRMRVYENICIDAVTDKILRIHSENAPEKSHAIEKEISYQESLRESAVPETGEKLFQTEALEIRVSVNGAIDMN